MSKPGLLLGCLVVLGATPALACIPSPRTVSPVPVEGPALCEYRIDLNATDVLRQSPIAGVLGESGLMSILHGNACLNRQDLVVVDCAAGLAMVVGPQSGGQEADFVPFDTGLEGVMLPLAVAFEDGEAVSLDDVADLALQWGFDTPQIVPLAEGLERAGHVLPLGCFCSARPPA